MSKAFCACVVEGPSETPSLQELEHLLDASYARHFSDHQLRSRMREYISSDEQDSLASFLPEVIVHVYCVVMLFPFKWLQVSGYVLLPVWQKA